MKIQDIRVLERIFDAEINGRLPAQFRSNRLETLALSGHVAPMTRYLGGNWPVRIDGWQLTELGRMTYCQWAEEQKTGDAREGGK